MSIKVGPVVAGIVGPGVDTTAGASVGMGVGRGNPETGKSVLTMRIRDDQAMI